MKRSGNTPEAIAEKLESSAAALERISTNTQPALPEDVTSRLLSLASKAWDRAARVRTGEIPIDRALAMKLSLENAVELAQLQIRALKRRG